MAVVEQWKVLWEARCQRTEKLEHEDGSFVMVLPLLPRLAGTK